MNSLEIYIPLQAAVPVTGVIESAAEEVEETVTQDVWGHESSIPYLELNVTLQE